jgi:hypothetical protein
MDCQNMLKLALIQIALYLHALMGQFHSLDSKRHTVSSPYPENKGFGTLIATNSAKECSSRVAFKERGNIPLNGQPELVRGLLLRVSWKIEWLECIRRTLHIKTAPPWSQFWGNA